MTTYFKNLRVENYSYLVKLTHRYKEKLTASDRYYLLHAATEKSIFFARIAKYTFFNMARYEIFIPRFFNHYKPHPHDLIGSMYQIHETVIREAISSTLSDKTMAYLKDITFNLLDKVKDKKTNNNHDFWFELQQIKFLNSDEVEISLYDHLSSIYSDGLEDLLPGYVAFMAFLNSIYLLEQDESYNHIKLVQIKKTSNKKMRAKKKKNSPSPFLNEFALFEPIKELYNSNGKRKIYREKLTKHLAKTPNSSKFIAYFENNFASIKDKTSIQAQKLFVEFIIETADQGFAHGNIDLPSIAQGPEQQITDKETKTSTKKTSTTKKKKKGQRKNSPHNFNDATEVRSRDIALSTIKKNRRMTDSRLRDEKSLQNNKKPNGFLGKNLPDYPEKRKKNTTKKKRRHNSDRPHNEQKSDIDSLTAKASSKNARHSKPHKAENKTRNILSQVTVFKDHIQWKQIEKNDQLKKNENRLIESAKKIDSFNHETYNNKQSNIEKHIDIQHKLDLSDKLDHSVIETLKQKNLKMLVENTASSHENDRLRSHMGLLNRHIQVMSENTNRALINSERYLNVAYSENYKYKSYIKFVIEHHESLIENHDHQGDDPCFYKTCDHFLFTNLTK